ncbi:MAG: hypothetical protein D6767_00390 [Candidatus Hydrogenedentota bacterium]|nr:MAG: hypothetical protein D6767_00390 [Candidatus Hydrogenedentota bacterium]
MQEPKKFRYDPEIRYDEIREDDDAACIEALKEFKKGFLYPQETHVLNADGLRKYINSASVTPDIRADFRFKQNDIEQALNEIVRQYSELEAALDEKNLETAATRDYYNIFQSADILPEKLDYVKFLKTYEALKWFNKRVREQWQIIREIFEGIKVNTFNELFLEQVLLYKTYPRLELCDMTDLLLRRMAYILKIKKEKEEGSRIVAEGEYTSVIRYGLSTIFQPDLKDVLSGITEIKKEEKKKKITSYADVKDSAIVNPYLLDTRGDRHFNQSYLYILQVNQDKLAIERQRIQKAVYIETHLGAEETALRQDLIRKFISTARSKNRAEEYKEFLFEYFNFTCESILLHFMDFDEDKKKLFLYHLGPIYFLKMVMHFMREGRTGFIHRHYYKDQMLRELPFNFLKYVLIQWWDTNIFQKTTKANRNSYEIYLSFVQKMATMWLAERDKVIEGIQSDNMLRRAYEAHDHKTLMPYVENVVSYLYATLFVRFLSQDFIFLPEGRLKKLAGGESITI